MIFSIVVFLVIFFLLIASFVSNRTYRFALSVPLCFFYSLLIGFRSNTGSDTFLYQNFFYDRSYPSANFVEPGVEVLFDTFNVFNSNFDMFIFFHGIIVFIGLLALLRYKDSLFVAFYIVLIGINVDTSTLRQSLALHFFMISVFIFRHYAISTVIASLFHLSSISSFFSKISSIKFSVLSVLAMATLSFAFYYLFLSRYMEVGRDFLFRDGFSFLMQTLFVFLFVVLSGYKFPIIAFSTFLSIIPIGYRVIFFVLVTSESLLRPRNAINHLLLVMMMILYSSVKVFSFYYQSSFNDAERSVVLFFDRLFFI